MQATCTQRAVADGSASKGGAPDVGVVGVEGAAAGGGLVVGVAGIVGVAVEVAVAVVVVVVVVVVAVVVVVVVTVAAVAAVVVLAWLWAWKVPTCQAVSIASKRKKPTGHLEKIQVCFGYVSGMLWVRYGTPFLTCADLL